MKSRFVELYHNYIHRTGAEALFDWLEHSDFFTAPASTRFHGAYEGGLLQHSLNVYQRLDSLLANDCENVNFDRKVEYPGLESVAICGLLHDLCKVNFYAVSERNTKDENGRWIKVPYYTVEEAFPYGHGEKSVFLIERFMKLTTEEAMTIRWHMGGFDDSVRGGSFAAGAAFSKSPLALMLHIADMQATYFDEKEEQ